jgi:hypothetical protein
MASTDAGSRRERLAAATRASVLAATLTAIGFGAEVFTTRSLRKTDEPIYTLDEALAFAVTPNLQLDFGGNFGLNGAPPQVQP